ncbi:MULTISPECIES: integrase domain-containing protein [unclassified Serratia (in: enterobacteria)]|uniref:integrase domain-containing protein n=1 Tax=unclassified Serratia (in: enterobacteria) TaxID=2647522 RepID=UPI0005034422|nr:MULTISPECIES: integrase domain-containing protein [unclassified Serratia (in: enterobacteria)]KFK94272.1 integrase [Serratia sp. Ag2]KFK98314.1 integrase [Serratia sp. Ag1]
MPVKTKPLTNTEIRSAKATSKDLSLYDGDGLILYVKLSGSKVWRFRYYKPITGKRQTMTIGAYPEISLADARQHREDARALLAKGIDPQEYKREVMTEAYEAKANTLAKVAADWLAVKISQNLSENTIKQINRMLNVYLLPSMGSVPVTMITPRRVIEAMETLKEAGRLETIHRAVQRLREIMDYAANAGYITANPISRISTAFSQPVRTNNPTIRPEGLPRLLQLVAVSRLELQTRLLIEWQLLTMTRPREAADTEWSEIDIKAKVWVISADRMKMKREHVIPLCQQALDVIQAMKAISGNRVHVFPSFKNPQKPMSSQTVNMALKRMGYKGELVSHGLRSIASTALNEEGFNPDVIEAALAHRGKDAVRNAYNRSTYLEQRRVMMDFWGNYVEQAASGQVMASGGLRGLRSIAS